MNSSEHLSTDISMAHILTDHVTETAPQAPNTPSNELVPNVPIDLTQLQLGIADVAFGNDIELSSTYRATDSQPVIRPSQLPPREPSHLPNAKLARAFDGITLMLMDEAFRDGKLPTIPQIAIQLRCSIDHITKALDILFQREIAAPVNGRWYRIGSQAEQEARGHIQTPPIKKHRSLSSAKSHLVIEQFSRDDLE